MTEKKITYKSSGVDIQAGDNFVEWIKSKSSDKKLIGGFSGLFPVPMKGYKEPQLVASTDGVGTKLIIAEMMNVHNTIGIDLVAMVVNDLVVCGAKPLFFLDYFAAGKLVPETAKSVLEGIMNGCNQAGCILLGGETAELPGIYSGKTYDLAGFGIGIVDKSKVIDGKKIKKGNVVIGLASSGLHSNGYSLARKVFFDANKCKINKKFPELEKTLGEELLKPTIILVKPILDIIKNAEVLGMANITGGGIEGNLCRVLPKKYDAVIDTESWQIPPIFKLIEKLGPVDKSEMFKSLNMGIGMTLVAPKEEADQIIKIAAKHKINAYVIGEITSGTGKVILK